MLALWMLLAIRMEWIMLAVKEIWAVEPPCCIVTGGFSRRRKQIN